MERAFGMPNRAPSIADKFNSDDRRRLGRENNGYPRVARVLHELDLRLVQVARCFGVVAFTIQTLAMLTSPGHLAAASRPAMAGRPWRLGRFFQRLSPQRRVALW